MIKHIKYIPLALFLTYGIKSLILSSTYVDGAILLVLGLVASFYEFKDQEQKLTDLESKLTDMSVNVKNVEKSLEEIKSNLSGIKLGQQMRHSGVR